jgi:phosphoglycolate phosphatase
MKTHIALDMDGTIFDCGEIILDAYHEGLIRFKQLSRSDSIPMPSWQKIMSVIGTPNDSIFDALFPAQSIKERIEINKMCSDSLVGRVRKGGGTIFEGVAATMKELHDNGYIMHAASNGTRAYIEAILETNNLIRYISKPVVTIDDGLADKTDIVRRYRRDIAADNPLIMIGDRQSDRMAAEENAIPFIGCSFGHAGISEIDGARWIARGFSEIPAIVLKIEKEIISGLSGR